MPEVPRCVGIIMDGNRRWARARGLPTIAGHEAGARALGDAAQHAFARGTETLIVYAFSTENWNRAPEEVQGLMHLFEKLFSEDLTRLAEEGICIRFIGDRSRASQDLQERMVKVETASANGTRGTLVTAFSYGARSEIVAAANRLVTEGKPVTEASFAGALMTADLPDPDFIIRTGGEQRLSNFLLWQSAYAELAFTDTLWPDLDAQELDRLYADFASRERRHGR